MKENILREIFFDENGNWDRFITKYNNRIREVVKKEVEKYRKCGDIGNGSELWVCEGCHDVRIVPYRCKKSRFCNTCACGETEE